MWAVKLRRIRQIITRTKYGEIIGLALIINLGTQLMDAVCRPHTRHNAHIFKHTNPTMNGDENNLFFLASRLIGVVGGSTYCNLNISVMFLVRIDMKEQWQCKKWYLPELTRSVNC